MVDSIELSLSEEKLLEYIQKKESFLLFDLRRKENYEKAHIEGSVHAVCDTRAKETIMPKIPKNIKIVLLDDGGKMADETAKMMHSMGLDAHYLKGGMKSWSGNTVQGIPQRSIDAQTLWSKLQKNENLFLLDVRDRDEFSEFKIPGSINIPLTEVFKQENISKIPKDKDIITICPHGNRAMVATFALARNNINAHVLEGGLAGWSQVLNPVKAANDPTVYQLEKVGKGCLSYVVVSEGQAIVIDPLYPPQKYQELAQKNGFKIIKVIDTHQHADHISSAQDLSNLTKSEIYESNLEVWDRTAKFLSDKDELKFGNSTLNVMHTPGHTPGSLSYLIDEKFVFTGDILFIESIGRPDLRDKAEEFASELYDSLHNKLLNLPPETIVFPAHHGETVKPVDGVFSTTIEKANKHDVLKLSKDEFIKQVVGLTLPRPMNYTKIIQINKGSIPLNAKEIPDLELGPNRCSIAGQ